MDPMKNVNGKLLRCGYTTGSCATAAAKAAAAMLLGGCKVKKVSIDTPGGTTLILDLLDCKTDGCKASCAVRKDSGDDPDVTNGILVYATVKKTSAATTISGGEGVGRVTKPGLDQPVGEWAINSTPRSMITRELEKQADAYGYSGGFSVVISIPGGEALAKRTFNPRMGIEGGISVIGTTGIVEPMSNQALADTIRLELGQLRTTGADNLLLTPGNYGAAFAKEHLGLAMHNHIICSNFIGDAIDCAVELGFSRILLVGHIGKLVKLGIGITNTHSAFGDGRMEMLAACTLEAGGCIPLLKEIMQSVTTDGALGLIAQAGLLPRVMEILGRRIDACLCRKVPGVITIGYVCFTNSAPLGGLLSQSKNAETLMKAL